MSIIVANNELTREILNKLGIEPKRTGDDKGYMIIYSTPSIYTVPLSREPHSSDIELGIPDLQEMLLLHAMSLPIAEILDIVIDKKLGIE